MPPRRRINRVEVERRLARDNNQFEHEGVLYRFDGRPIFKLIQAGRQVMERRVSAFWLLFGLRPSTVAASLLAYWNYDDPWGVSVWVGHASHLQLLQHLIP